MPATTAVFDSERAHYTAELWSHGTVLTYFPRAVGTLCDGVKVAEGQRLVTLANTGAAVLDALTVARLHAASLGHPEPTMHEETA